MWEVWGTGIGNRCGDCHSAQMWQSNGSLLSKGPGVHTQLEGGWSHRVLTGLHQARHLKLPPSSWKITQKRSYCLGSMQLGGHTSLRTLISEGKWNDFNNNVSISVVSAWIKETLVHCWWECKLVQPLWGTVWRFIKTLKIELSYDSAISLFGINQRE